ncbi:SAM-dependent methyltransferase [Friedmanniella antarctica]|uniref:SAM-dependent methyltransferase n=2 Tax=Microlunatus antarcticus TaxID=53388 RepID=A0A7W5P5L0_9ACTN|nr:SAM-dependent methyltransferase [Microlunatus antarcticus]
MSGMPYGLSAEALAAAEAEADLESLAAGTRLRARFAPELAAAALTQAALRRRARTKFGDAAGSLWFTRDGLEQATRPEVADLHAQRFVAAGVRRVVDLGCGIGSDAVAFVRAGLDVLAVERDPATADVARANLATAVAAAGGSVHAEVVVADVADVIAAGIEPGVGVFADPARRDARGRVWRAQDFSPDLGSLLALAGGVSGGERVLGLKLGPALPHALVPPDAEAEWVSHHGDVVEVALWHGPGSVPGRRSALLAPDRRLVAGPAHLDVRAPGAYVFEPDGAVVRSGAVGVLGERLGAGLLAEQIAYLTADALVETPYATAFAVEQVLPYDLKALRRWVREAGIGRLEVKKRGLDVDPAQLRRDLRPKGDGSATLLLSRAPTGTVALVVHRVVAPG